ncbi:hypothetical protein MMC11_003186 [Xylographa trunciseda]|nr:hypothetical protein [Xylographa trunciseda]
MGKVQKAKLKKHQSHPYRKPFKEPQTRKSIGKAATKRPQASQKPILPFSPNDRILLIGEGNFTFAESIVLHHACTALTATTLETHVTLLVKHPQAASHINTLELAGQKVLYSIDGTKLGLPLPTGGGPAIRKFPWDRIIFNFPHVGGLTKDVNRQVRANQELLVKFLERAKALLAPGGTIVVTVFEGEPYSLWNLRDLGRHVGLKVLRSFKFDAGIYKGYKHARTLGNIEGGGVWKGEDRDARTYIFGFDIKEHLQGVKSTKNNQADSDDDDSLEGVDD